MPVVDILHGLILFVREEVDSSKGKVAFRGSAKKSWEQCGFNKNDFAFCILDLEYCL